jgi:hypothetical protein
MLVAEGSLYRGFAVHDKRYTVYTGIIFITEASKNVERSIFGGKKIHFINADSRA